MKIFKFIKDLFSSEKKEEKKESNIEVDSEGREIENIDVKDDRFIKMKCPMCNHKKAKKTASGEIKCRKCHQIIGRVTE